MQAIYNLILSESGFTPVGIAENDLNSVCGAAWYNFVNVEKWVKDSKFYTTKEALQLLEKENK